MRGNTEGFNLCCMMMLFAQFFCRYTCVVSMHVDPHRHGCTLWVNMWTAKVEARHDLSSSFNLFMVQDFSRRPRVVWLVPSIHCLRSGITGQQPLPPGLYTALEPWISAHFLVQQPFNHSSISPDFVPRSLTFSWFALLQANTSFISILLNTLTLDSGRKLFVWE